MAVWSCDRTFEGQILSLHLDTSGRIITSDDISWRAFICLHGIQRNTNGRGQYTSEPENSIPKYSQVILYRTVRSPIVLNDKVAKMIFLHNTIIEDPILPFAGPTCLVMCGKVNINSMPRVPPSHSIDQTPNDPNPSDAFRLSLDSLVYQPKDVVKCFGFRDWPNSISSPGNFT